MTRRAVGCGFLIGLAGACLACGPDNPAAPSSGPRDARHQVTGVVTVSGEPGTPVAGATVEVAAGPETGGSATTDAQGRYQMHLSRGESVLRVVKDGFVTREQPITISAAAELNILLERVDPGVSIAGDYTLTIRAADDCPPPTSEPSLPALARLRRYQATVGQTGNAVTVTLSGATFFTTASGGAARGDRFSGRIAGDQLVFTLADEPWDYPWDYSDPYFDIMEWFAEPPSPSRFVVIGGSVRAPHRNLAGGTLDGAIGIVRSLNPTQWDAWCGSTKHQFSLTR